MSKKERKERIEALETRLFLIMMVDRWTDRDRELYRQVTNELDELKAMA